MAVLLALVAAASWGTADFLGGLTGRRTSAIAVTFASQLTGLVALLAPVALIGGAPTARDLVWGALAGIGGGAGVTLLYRGLAIGRMGVVAPVTALGAAVIPVVFGLVRGERPSAVAVAGVGLALVAIALVAREPSAASDASVRASAGVPEALAAGVGFAAFFIALDRAADAAGLWPLLPMRTASTALAAAIGVGLRRPIAPPRATWPTLTAVGVLDAAASTGFLLATRTGLLSLVAVLGSLYPVVTVALARLVLHERLHRLQLVGSGVAVAAVALIAAG